MTQFDDDIRGALTDDDAAFLETLHTKDGLFSHLGSTMTGPMGWVSKGALLMAFIFSGLMFWTAWQAFHADTLRLTVLWSAGFVSSLICQGLLKIWLYNRANTLSVIRDIKRMELRLLQKMGQ